MTANGIFNRMTGWARRNIAPVRFIADNIEFARFGAEWISASVDGRIGLIRVPLSGERGGYDGERLIFEIGVDTEEIHCDCGELLASLKYCGDTEGEFAIELIKRGFRLPEEDEMRRMAWALEFWLGVFVAGGELSIDEETYANDDGSYFPPEDNCAYRKYLDERDFDGLQRVPAFSFEAGVGRLGERFARARAAAAAAYVARAMGLVCYELPEDDWHWFDQADRSLTRFSLAPGMLALAIRLWIGYPRRAVSRGGAQPS